MKTLFRGIVMCVSLLMVSILSSNLHAAEGDEVAKNWGDSFSIGIPVGLYNEDIYVGLELAYPVIDTIVLRLNAPCLIDRYRYNELTWKGLRNKSSAWPVLYPSFSFIGRSPLVYNLRVYGGATVGIAYVKKNMPIMPHVEGFGGVEFWALKRHSFFVEFGGGATIAKRDIDFSRGVLITGGSRFYF